MDVKESSRITVRNLACKDYSEEYQALYHEHMAKMLEERPWIWSSHVWNMFDFDVQPETKQA